MPIGLATALAGEMRRNNYRAGLRSILLEHADVNRCPRSEDLSLWTKSAGTGAATGGQADPMGGTSAFKLDDTDGAIDVNWGSPNFLAYSGAATSRGYSFYAKADTSAAGDVGIFDVTAAAYRMRITVTNTAGVITAAIASGTGSIVAVLPATDAPGWYRILVQVTGLTPANTHKFFLRPAGQVGTNVGAMLFWGFMAHDSTVPCHSYVPNPGTGSVTCDADNLALPWRVAPGALSIYTKYREIGSQMLAVSGGLSVRQCEIAGPNSTLPRVILLHPGSQHFRLQIESPAGNALSTTSGTPTLVYDDIIEAFGWIYQDATCRVGVSINGAAPILGNLSTALPAGFPPAWSSDGLVASQKLRPGATGVNGPREQIAMAPFPGIFTLDEMRSLALR